jgi:hypothetical protein
MMAGVDMPPKWRAVLIVVAVAGIVSTPLFWLLNNPDTGQLVAASVQGLVAIAAFVWVLMQPPAPTPAPPAGSAGADRAAHGPCPRGVDTCSCRYAASVSVADCCS